MSYCSKCGQDLPDGAKFCFNCGKQIDSVSESTSTNTINKGDVYKCPNCGEILNSFTLICPACNYEIRDFSASVQLLSEKLENIESIDEKALFIKNYPIPNTKEDILEFMILASSNIKRESNKLIFNAWISKFEQTYKKAQLTLATDALYAKIEEIYKRTKTNIVKGTISIVLRDIAKTFLIFYKMMPNPVFAIVTVLIILFNVISLCMLEYTLLHTIISAVILVITYNVTENKKSAKNNNSSNNQLDEIKIPIQIAVGTSENFAVVENILRNVGFINIKTVPLNDLTFITKNKNGKVDNIYINDKELSSYYKRKFPADSSIIITYHSIRTINNTEV